MNIVRAFRLPVLAAGLSLCVLAPAKAEMLNTYIGIDTAQTLSFGVYAGLPNPNFGRLTFLQPTPISTTCRTTTTTASVRGPTPAPSAPPW